MDFGAFVKQTIGPAAISVGAAAGTAALTGGDAGQAALDAAKGAAAGVALQAAGPVLIVVALLIFGG